MISVRLSTRARAASVCVLTLAAALVGAIGAHAGGGPAARSAAANTLIATIADTTPADRSYTTYLKITGQIQSPSHKFAPRKCRSGRVIDIVSPTVGGAIAEVGSSYPTSKTGHFGVEFQFEYAGTLSDGSFRDGYAPSSGGTATFILSTGKLKVQKVKGDPFRTYTCRPLRLTVQITVPPVPPA
jgi:hypothetical protein